MIELLKEYPIMYDFLMSLHWPYMLVLLTMMFGIKHTKELDWFKDYLIKKKMGKGVSWIAAIIIASLFMVFRWLDKELIFDSVYVASLLRTLVIGVILSKAIVDTLTKFIKDKIK